MVLERATNRRYADLLSERLWKPLGNSDAAVCLDRPGGRARTFGFLFATARDWARVGELVRNEGKVDGREIVPATWIQFHVHASPTDQNYGAGIYTGVDDPEDSILRSSRRTPSSSTAATSSVFTSCRRVGS